MILPIGDVQKPEKTPYVNYALLGINIFVFLFIQPNEFTASAGENYFFEEHAFVPARFSLLGILFSMFLHANLLHLGGNMLFLWIAGDNVEDRLGKGGYIFFYLACGFAASMTHFLFNIGSIVPCIGASGAIAGVMGAYFLLCPRNQVKVFYWIWFYIGTFYISARVAVGFWFVEQVIMFLIYRKSGVAIDAHIGGIIFGFLVTLALIKARIASPYLAVERHTGSFRKASPFAHDHRGRPFIQSPGSSPYSRYSDQRHLFRNEPEQREDWLSDSYAAPAYTPSWQQAAPVSGLFTVIAGRPIGGKAQQIAPTVASFTGNTPEQAARNLHADYGVLARRVPGSLAASLQASLMQFDVPVIMMRSEETVDLPPARELSDLAPGSMGVILYFDGGSLGKRREEIFLAVCGKVAGRLILDIYAYQPWTRFRISEGSAAFRHPTEENIRNIMTRILRAQNIPVNRGVKALVDGGGWEGATYVSHDDFDRYCYWLIQVVNARNRGMA